MAPLALDLWLWPLDPDAATVARLAAHLAPEEEARARRFVQPRHGHQFRVGRGRLREILGPYRDTAPAALRFVHNAHGKPALPGGPAFNLSHAGGWAALAVAPDADPALALGIDIEAHRPVEPEVAERFFAPAEVRALAALPPALWAEGFFRCWTRKEAVVKACGPGLSMPLRDFDVTLAPEAPARLLRLDPVWGRAADWTLHHLDLAPRFVGAIAAQMGGAPLALTLREGRLPLG
jgi:4'-phosphopantetheinyl transferase